MLPKENKMARKKKKTTDDIVEGLIDKVGEIIDYRLGVALGHEPPEGHEHYNVAEQIRMMELAKPLIQGHQSAKAIKAKTSADIINMVGRGKITATEAQEMMKLLLLKQEVDDIESFND